jgi:hypothetical protein
VANKKLFGMMLGAVLAFWLTASGCSTIGKENYGSFSSVTVPAKDFSSLGLVFTENMIENNEGKVFTYNELLKQAKELGGDSIVNVVIDVKREGKKFLGMYFNPKETWYGSATAIKYADGTLEGVVMSGSGSSSGSGATSSGKKWYNPFTWFK